MIDIAPRLSKVSPKPIKPTRKPSATVPKGRKPRLRLSPYKVSLGVVLSTTGFSMLLNVIGFTGHAETIQGVALGILSGIALPLWVLAFSYLGFERLTVGAKAQAIACAAIAGFLLYVSVPHLAEGFAAILGCSEWEAFALAVALDVGQIVAKTRLAKH